MSIPSNDRCPRCGTPYMSPPTAGESYENRYCGTCESKAGVHGSSSSNLKVAVADDLELQPSETESGSQLIVPAARSTKRVGIAAKSTARVPIAAKSTARPGVAARSSHRMASAVVPQIAPPPSAVLNQPESKPLPIGSIISGVLVVVALFVGYNAIVYLSKSEPVVAETPEVPAEPVKVAPQVAKAPDTKKVLDTSKPPVVAKTSVAKPAPAINAIGVTGPAPVAGVSAGLIDNGQAPKKEVALEDVSAIRAKGSRAQGDDEDETKRVKKKPAVVPVPEAPAAEKPVEPEKPVVAEKPVVVEKPVVPEKPAAPEKPAVPETPAVAKAAPPRLVGKPIIAPTQAAVPKAEAEPPALVVVDPKAEEEKEKAAAAVAAAAAAGNKDALRELATGKKEALPTFGPVAVTATQPQVMPLDIERVAGEDKTTTQAIAEIMPNWRVRDAAAAASKLGVAFGNREQAVGLSPRSNTLPAALVGTLEIPKSFSSTSPVLAFEIASDKTKSWLLSVKVKGVETISLVKVKSDTDNPWQDVQVPLFGMIDKHFDVQIEVHSPNKAKNAKGPFEVGYLRNLRLEWKGKKAN